MLRERPFVAASVIRFSHQRLTLWSWAPALVLTTAASLMAAGAAAAPLKTEASAYTGGDLLVGLGGGRVDWHRPNGTLVRTIVNPRGGQTRGMAFDSTGSLYLATYGPVVKFDSNGNSLGVFFTPPDGDIAGSVVFDSGDNAYVGTGPWRGSPIPQDVYKVSKAGAILARYDVDLKSFPDDTSPATNGPFWIRLAANQCTLYYASMSAPPRINRFDVCAGGQLPDFDVDVGLNDYFQFDLLPDGGVIAAARDEIVRLSAAGQVVQRYNVPGSPLGADAWQSLALTVDETSFWAGNTQTQNVYRFDLASGAVLQTIASGQVEALAVAPGTATPKPGGGGISGGPAPGRPPGKVKLPGSKSFVTISAGQALPPGTVVDVSSGAGVTLTDPKGNQAAFYGDKDSVPSVFVYAGVVGGFVELRLAGGNFKSCPKRVTAAVSKKAKPVRRLWGKGKGSFRTKGRYVTAAIRGTWWLTADLCDSSVVTVKEGVMTVRDLVKKKTLVVRAGKTYTAKARP